MQYDRLFWLGEDFGNDDALRGQPQQGMIRDEFALLRGSEKPADPIRFDRHAESGGDVLCDVVWTTLVQPVLISNRVAETFRQASISGWTTYLVALYDRKGVRIPGYHGLAVTGRCGEIDRTRSTQVQLEPYGPGLKSPRIWRGLYFKDDRWDGSDISLPERTGYIILTERAKNSLESLRIPNVKFHRLDTDETHI